jgi:hypothetical protein
MKNPKEVKKLSNRESHYCAGKMVKIREHVRNHQGRIRRSIKVCRKIFNLPRNQVIGNNKTRKSAKKLPIKLKLKYSVWWSIHPCCCTQWLETDNNTLIYSGNNINPEGYNVESIYKNK